MSRAKTLQFKSEGRDQRFDRATWGIDVDVDLLQLLIKSTAKQQLAADRLTPAVVEIDLRELVEQLEEALEDNSGRLDEILKLLKGKNK